VFKIKNPVEIKKYFSTVLKYSREEQILLEEYYESDEITVSGWVQDEELKILTITDRITYEQDLNIGICTAHIFPSRYLTKYYKQIKNISESIVQSFQIKDGPIYFQMLIGQKGIKVNEIACRIGGAYEADFMPLITGVDMLAMVINSALGREINTSPLKDYHILDNNNWLSVQLFFAQEGKISKIENLDKIKKLKEVIQIKLNFQENEIIPEIENATARAGYFIVKGRNKKELKENIKKVYDLLKIYDVKNQNLVLREAGEIL
jgi:phosphoribosylamine-glycine ligase